MGSNNSVVKKEYLEIKYKSFRNIFPTPVSIYCPVCGEKDSENRIKFIEYHGVCLYDAILGSIGDNNNLNLFNYMDNNYETLLFIFNILEKK